MPKKKVTAAATILVGLVFVIAAVSLAAAFSKIYYLRQYAGGSLVWHRDEAYLFLFESRVGYQINYIEYPWVLLREYLNSPPLPYDRRSLLTVIRVTSSAVERRVVEFGDRDTFPRYLTPFGERIYARCPGDVLCKWTGIDFEVATEEEQRDLDGVHRLDGAVAGELNEWSKRGVGPAPHDQFAVEVGKEFTLSIKNGATNKGEQPKISIDVLRPGQSSERDLVSRRNPPGTSARWSMRTSLGTIDLARASVVLGKLSFDVLRRLPVPKK
jgi:hypothetical protein